jgi:hypothetical protein
MDNRPDPIEDEQTTPEHESGRVGHAGYDLAQPDRSGAESADRKRATDDSATAEIPGAGRPAIADKQHASDDLRQPRAPVMNTMTAAARNVLRRYPAHVATGAIGILILGSALAISMARKRKAKFSSTGMD